MVEGLNASRIPHDPVVAVIGDGDPRGPDAHRVLEWAEEVGTLLARAGATVVTGGLGGVMQAASKGALNVGIAPVLIDRNGRFKREDVRPDVPIITALDQLLPIVDARGVADSARSA